MNGLGRMEHPADTMVNGVTFIVNDYMLVVSSQ
jgi:hypothetical protein